MKRLRIPYFELIPMEEWNLETENVGQTIIRAGEYNTHLFEQTNQKQKIKNKKRWLN